MGSIRDERGTVLITSVIAVLLIASLSAALLTTVAVENGQSVSNDDLVTADFLADGAAEMAEKLVLKTVVNWLELPEGVVDARLGNHDIHFQVSPAGAHWVTFDLDGTRVLNQPVLIEAWTTVDGFRRDVKRLINVGVSPLFQFTVFYDGDLEILPSPNMTITGRIHTNSDLYLGSDNTLTLDCGYVHAVGDILRRRKDSELPTGGAVLVRGRTTGILPMESKFQLAAIGVPSESGFDSSFVGNDINGDGDYIDAGELSPWVVESIERWGGNVQSAVHGLRELVAPDLKSIKRYVRTETGSGGDYELDPESGEFYEVSPGTGAYRKGHFHQMSDVVIIDGELFEADGDSVNVPPGVLVTKQMYDAREGKYIAVTEIDLSLLAASGLWPANGLLYAARTDASVSSPNGIRLKNGAQLAEKLTVVSEDPIFILGNYNSVNKKGAAVIGDAVNVLSGAWNDSKQPGTLPLATPTTVMAAIITGSYETSEGNYNGGFENMVRFHENWFGVPCTIYGSFVNIFNSDIAKGPWRFGSDVYQPPVRRFDFDNDFKQITKLPPFTPVVAYVRRIAWYEGGNFDEEIAEQGEIEP